jgi:pilus assembly protein CpaB
MRKPGNVFLLAILIATFTATLVYRSMRNQRAELETMRRAASNQVREVLVADAPIPIGTRIQESHVRLTSWPADLQPEGALTNRQAAVGRVALATIARNQPVLGSHLTSEGAGLLPLMIEEGMRGMSVKVDNVTGVSGFITPNSRVDVLVAGSADGSGNDNKRSRVILQNVRVLATGKSIEQRDEKPVEVPTVTLLVSPEEAERLTLATTYEPVRLALRNYRDGDVVTTQGVSATQLFATKPPTPTNGHRKRAPEPPSVEVWLGDMRSKQTF